MYRVPVVNQHTVVQGQSDIMSSTHETQEQRPTNTLILGLVEFSYSVMRDGLT